MHQLNPICAASVAWTTATHRCPTHPAIHAGPACTRRRRARRPASGTASRRHCRPQPAAAARDGRAGCAGSPRGGGCGAQGGRLGQGTPGCGGFWSRPVDLPTGRRCVLACAAARPVLNHGRARKSRCCKHHADACLCRPTASWCGSAQCRSLPAAGRPSRQPAQQQRPAGLRG